MDVWFEHSVPKVKLNLGRTVVTDVRQMPDERGRTGLVNVPRKRLALAWGGLKPAPGTALRASSPGPRTGRWGRAPSLKRMRFKRLLTDVRPPASPRSCCSTLQVRAVFDPDICQSAIDKCSQADLTVRHPPGVHCPLQSNLGGLAHPGRLAIRASRIALAFVSIRSEVRTMPSVAQARSTIANSLALSGSSRRCAASPRAPKTVVRLAEWSTGTSAGCPSASVMPTP